MAHWLGLYGRRILVVHYEELVRNLETSAVGLYRHCSLDFDPVTFNHNFTTDQIDHWRNYEPYLNSVRQALGGGGRF